MAATISLNITCYFSVQGTRQKQKLTALTENKIWFQIIDYIRQQIGLKEIFRKNRFITFAIFAGSVELL
jgi:hypothetical protein